MLGIPSITLLAVVCIYVQKVRCISKYGCYGSPDLFCSHHTLTCGDKEVIGIDAPRNPIAVLDKIQLPGCDAIVERDSCRKSCCGQAGLANKCPRNEHQSLTNQSAEDINMDDLEISLDDLDIRLDDFVLDVYKKCSMRRSCTVAPPFHDINQTSSCIRYQFICIEESLVYNMLKPLSILKHNTLMLSFIGRGRHENISLSCSCKVQSSHEVRMSSLYIHLRNNTNGQVAISADHFLPFDRESDVNVMYGHMVEFSTYPFTIEFNNYLPSEDDIIWIEFLTVGNFLTATCSGCDVPLWNLKVAAAESGSHSVLLDGFRSSQSSIIVFVLIILFKDPLF